MYSMLYNDKWQEMASTEGKDLLLFPATLTVCRTLQEVKTTFENWYSPLTITLS